MLCFRYSTSPSVYNHDVNFSAVVSYGKRYLCATCLCHVFEHRKCDPYSDEQRVIRMIARETVSTTSLQTSTLRAAEMTHEIQTSQDVEHIDVIPASPTPSGVQELDIGARNIVPQDSGREDDSVAPPDQDNV